MKTSIALRRGWACPLLVLACACSDRDAILPSPAAQPGSSLVRIECSVTVATRQMACAPAPASAGAVAARGNKIVGGQETYVKLSSSGTSYDSGTEIFQSSVTVQNLLRQAMGTPDGNTVSGVSVFFSSGPTVTSGSGIVTLANADGTGMFTGAAQPYFRYDQILSPFEISAAKTWQFNVPGTVGTFTFSVYVSASLLDEGAPLLDKVWTGTAGTDWFAAANWSDGQVPDSTSAVMIPADSLLASHNMPVLSADARVLHLRVGFGSTLALAGHTLRAGGNVDAPGAITSGTVQMDGAGALTRGSLSALSVTGGTSLQGSTTASGAVTVTGALNVKDQALSISIP
ncbi:MAG TPA: hypothetical protein VFE05_21305 [Longimicrobiaceae bacterium]|jgi:hypothetical protein|nr:hypothetical protein [Longimicrobiaceae bacterium]